MIIESDIERTLRERLNEYGFKVLKLYTPGNTGTMDRMILRPRYSPGPPMFVELKRPGKKLRPLQVAIGREWKQRGCMVLTPITTPHECEQTCHILIQLIMPDYMLGTNSRLQDANTM
jgi:hypothetical protein